MKKFEYDEITTRETYSGLIYEFGRQEFYSFLSALNTLGEEGWEWVGKHESHYILKREIPNDEEEF